MIQTLNFVFNYFYLQSNTIIICNHICVQCEENTIIFIHYIICGYIFYVSFYVLFKYYIERKLYMFYTINPMKFLNKLEHYYIIYFINIP